MSDDDECIHGMDPPLCSICNGREAANRRPVRAAAAPKEPRAPRAAKAPVSKAQSKRLQTTVVSTTSADTEESVEEYRSRYTGDKEATFDAYVLVFFTTDARTFPGGFLAFTKCANADPERRATAPALVMRAERFMRDAGYEADERGVVGGGRHWRLAD